MSLSLEHVAVKFGAAGNSGTTGGTTTVGVDVGAVTIGGSTLADVALALTHAPHAVGLADRLVPLGT
jgi:hypothetical protein